MANSSVKTLVAQEPTEKTSFFRRLWQSVLRFDEALNVDPHVDLERRVTDLEHRLKS